MSQHVIFLVLRRMRRPLIALIIVYAIASFGLTLIPGVDPDGNPWKMSFFHAFYFVSFMGSTIGFGEIPYPFTDYQRYWVLAFIYVTVVVWLYTIGTLLSLVQDPAFKHAVTNQSFSRAVSKLNSAFYIICGYGDTGKTLTKDLTALGHQVVVLDTDADTISEIQLNDFGSDVLSLTCDMTIPENLINAGLNHPKCQAIIALSDNDHANLKVAVSSKSLNPGLITVCRASDKDEITNLRSFNTDIIINPNELFAKRLIHSIQDPSGEQIVRWINSQNFIDKPHLPIQHTAPNGKWLICGYGEFSKAIKSQMDANDIPNAVIGEHSKCQDLPFDYIEGNGTDAPTLEKAGIEDAVGLVAGSPDDANNLSILLTAQQLNSDLFTIGRLNEQFNESVFSSAQPDLIFRDNTVMANAILTRLTRPLVTSFIHELKKCSTKETDSLLTSLKEMDAKEHLITWRTPINSKDAPAIAKKIAQKIDSVSETETKAESEITIDVLLSQANHDEQTIKCLMLFRDGSAQMTPAGDTKITMDDTLLFCGSPETLKQQKVILENIEHLDNLLNPDLPHIPLRRWLARRSA